MAAKIIVVSGNFTLKMMITRDLEKILVNDVITNASDLTQAANFLVFSAPNVILLDIESQRVTDAYLNMLRAKYNLHIIIIGTLNAANFIKSGITDIMSKPLTNNTFSFNIFIKGIVTKINNFLSNTQQKSPMPGSPAAGMGFGNNMGTIDAKHKIIAITASTGGTDALPAVLRDLPANIPPMLIVQHMPEVFTKQFADRLDKLCKFTVKEAESGDYLRKGMALLAPGNFHMRLIKKGPWLAVECVQTEKVHAVRPAADVLFHSMTPITGGTNVIGVILTGMGSDGARGLLELNKKGAVVIGQNAETCVVYGMPKSAYDMGAVTYQLPLGSIANKIISLM